MMQVLKQLITLLLLLFSISIFSLNNDKSKLAYISADKAQYNDKTGISIYYGNVKIDQGSTHLRGDKMIVYNTKDNKRVEKVIAFGNPAEYRTLPDNKKAELITHGLTIEYYPIQDKLVLIQQAKAMQGKDVITGERIEYQVSKQLMISSPAKADKTVIVIEQDE